MKVHFREHWRRWNQVLTSNYIFYETNWHILKYKSREYIQVVMSWKLDHVNKKMFINPIKNGVYILGSVPVETYSRNWIWPRSIFIKGSVWPWNWYCTHVNLNNVIWGIIPICKIFAKTWRCLFCFGVRYSFWPFALTRECALHLRPCEKTPETYFAGGPAGFSKTICSVPE